MSKPSDIVTIALAEVGYWEKASNASLDDKTANAGAANWTKYARDLAAAGYYDCYCKYYEVVYILFHTGMRISEFCGLTSGCLFRLTK